MAIEWDDVRVFRSAVLAGDYSSAGRKLDMDRTTVGRRFARLERAAGRALWEQAATGYRPTAAGRAVLRAAALMERAMTRLASDIDGQEAVLGGPIRVAGTAGIAALLLPAMADFAARYQAVTIELVGARDAIAAVQQRHADIGFAIARAKPGDLAGDRITSFEQRRYGLGSGCGQRAIGWGHAMLLSNPQPWARLNALPAKEVGLEVDTLPSLYAAVRAGLGNAWLWRGLGDRDPALAILPDQPPAAADAALWVVHRSDLAVEPAVVALRSAAPGIVATFLAMPV